MKNSSAVQPRFRIVCGKSVAMGPGKADLLEHVGAAGSIAEAAKRMGMSYMRAWTLVKTMEHCFKEPLVAVARGGAGHGGAQLTDTGRKVLNLYRAIERESLKATRVSQRRILGLLRTQPGRGNES
jgi:molybdate transport system regulatory protein